MFGKKPAMPKDLVTAYEAGLKADLDRNPIERSTTSPYAPPQYRESPLDAITAQIQSLKTELGAAELLVAQLRNEVTMADQERDEARRKLDEARGIFRVFLSSIESWDDDQPIPLPRKTKKKSKDNSHENHQVDPVVTVEPLDPGTTP